MVVCEPSRTAALSAKCSCAFVYRRSQRACVDRTDATGAACQGICLSQGVIRERPSSNPAGERSARPPSQRYFAFRWVCDDSVPSIFDESNSHDGAAVLCIAGYILKKARRSNSAANGGRFCSGKTSPIFGCPNVRTAVVHSLISPRLSADVATRMIAIIKRRAIQGIAITVDNLLFVSVGS